MDFESNRAAIEAERDGVVASQRRRISEADGALAAAEREHEASEAMLARQPDADHVHQRYAHTASVVRTRKAASDLVRADANPLIASVTGADAGEAITELAECRVEVQQFGESLADITSDIVDAAQRLGGGLGRLVEAGGDHYALAQREAEIARRLHLEPLRATFGPEFEFAKAVLAGLQASGGDVWAALDGIRRVSDVMRMQSAERHARAMREGDAHKAEALERIEKDRGELRTEGRLAWR